MYNTERFQSFIVYYYYRIFNEYKQTYRCSLLVLKILKTSVVQPETMSSFEMYKQLNVLHRKEKI
mgnify:CR=1 FL=1